MGSHPPQLHAISPDPPDFLPVGAAVKLCSIEALAREMQATVPQTIAALEKLQVPTITNGNASKVYFNLPTLELQLFRLLSAGGDDISFGQFARRYTGTFTREEVAIYKAIADIYHQGDVETMRARCRKMGEAMMDPKRKIAASKRNSYRLRIKHKGTVDVRQVRRRPGKRGRPPRLDI